MLQDTGTPLVHYSSACAVFSGLPRSYQSVGAWACAPCGPVWLLPHAALMTIVAVAAQTAGRDGACLVFCHVLRAPWRRGSLLPGCHALLVVLLQQLRYVVRGCAEPPHNSLLQRTRALLEIVALQEAPLPQHRGRPIAAKRRRRNNPDHSGSKVRRTEPAAVKPPSSSKHAASRPATLLLADWEAPATTVSVLKLNVLNCRMIFQRADASNPQPRTRANYTIQQQAGSQAHAQQPAANAVLRTSGRRGMQHAPRCGLETPPKLIHAAERTRKGALRCTAAARCMYVLCRAACHDNQIARPTHAPCAVPPRGAVCSIACMCCAAPWQGPSVKTTAPKRLQFGRKTCVSNKR